MPVKFLSISRVHSKRAAHRKSKDPGIDRADKKPVSAAQLITFRVSRRPRGMYCGHARLCVCLCVSVCLSVCMSAAACPHYCMDPDVIWGVVGDAP